MTAESLTLNHSARIPYPPPAVGWYATILLAVLYWFSILDRFIIGLLVDPIKRDLGITDVQFALLHGFAFAVTFSLFGLVAGVLADRFSRRWIIFASVTVWSLATAACGMVQHFWQMLLARVGVGAGEAGLNPSATSMLSDLFPRDKLTSALAVYAIGSSIGSGCAYLFGGMIVDMVAEYERIAIPLFGDVRSWQAVFFIVGLPGLLLSLLIFLVPEPVRRRTGNEPSVRKGTGFWRSAFGQYGDLLRYMGERKKFYLLHYLGFGFAAIVVTGSGPWYPAHMGRTFGWGAGEIGLSLGVTMVVGSVIGKLVCGYFVDAMYRKGFRDAQFRWYAACLVAATVVGVVAATSENPWVFLGGLALFLALLSPMPACAYAALNLATPAHLRGSGVAFFSATTGVVGVSVGPLLVAAVSDYVFGGGAIGYGLATLFAICCPVAAILLATGLQSMREAVTEAEDANPE